MGHPIKIVHVVHSLNVGGLENGLVNLLNGLDHGYLHTVLCLSRSGTMVGRITNGKVSVIEMDLPTDRFRFPILKLARIFRQVAPDIVHTRGWATVDAIFAARIANVSRVIHGEHGREAADPNGQNRKRIILRKVFSPLVNSFVAVSENLKTWLTETVGIAENKVLTIHNGVDTARFAPADSRTARLSLGIDDLEFTIGTVGRLDPVKDHGSLLRAFVPVARLRRPVRLVIAGDGSMRREIETLSQELGISDKVLLLGERQDIPEILNACDIFTLTSIAEGISNTILEAMASGLPIVATRVGGNAELVQSGVCGQLVAAGDVSGLTTAFESYLSNSQLRAAHSRNARLRAEREFGLEQMTAHYADLYCHVARGVPKQFS